MLTTMGGKRRTDRRATTPEGVTPSPQEEAGGGKAKPWNFIPSRELADALGEFQAKFEFPPAKTQIIERALRMYLRAHGFPIPEKPEKPGEAGD